MRGSIVIPPELASKFSAEFTNYEQRQKIGEGSFSQTFLATEKSTGESVALGIYKRPFTDDRENLGFVHELENLANCNHPCVMKLRGYAFTPGSDGLAVVVADYMPNGDIETAIRNGKLSPTEISKCIFGMIAGMAHLHSRGIMHRNLKPSIILLNEKREPVISRLDLSIRADFSNERIVSSPKFMAPELLDDETEDYSYPVDVYAFAVSLHVILGGGMELDDRPAPLRSSQQLLMRVLRGARFKRKAGIPDYHWSVITQCWVTDPHDRPTFLALLDEFQRNHAYAIAGTDMTVLSEFENRISPM
jgi:serine/threonine protein kinase